MSRHRVVDAGRVHFTHHLCLVHSEGPLWDDREDRTSCRGYIVHDSEKAYTSEFGSESSLVRRVPDLSCSNSRRKGEGSPLFTNLAGEVTCRLCRDKNKQNTEQAWAKKHAEARASDPNGYRGGRKYYSEWLSDEDLTIRAWWVCCRHRGAPSPFATTAEEQTYLRDRRAKALLKQAYVLKMVASQYKSYESFLPDLTASLDKLDVESREQLKPFLAQAAHADELLAKAQQAVSKLDELAHGAALRILYPSGKRSAKGRAA